MKIAFGKRSKIALIVCAALLALVLLALEIAPGIAKDWAVERPYMMASLRALVGRYSKLGDDAFYHLYLSTDNVFAAAMAGNQRPVL